MMVCPSCSPRSHLVHFQEETNSAKNQASMVGSLRVVVVGQEVEGQDVERDEEGRVHQAEDRGQGRRVGQT